MNHPVECFYFTYCTWQWQQSFRLIGFIINLLTISEKMSGKKGKGKGASAEGDSAEASGGSSKGGTSVKVNKY
jgi:hypothetical protein